MANLLERLKRREKEAFKEIYYDYYKLLYYVSLSLVRNVEVANDIVSETYLKFMDNVDKLKDINIKSYLTTICKNMSLNYLKKKETVPLDEILYKTESKDHNNLDVLLTLDSLLSKDEAFIVTCKIVYDYTFKEIANDFNIDYDKVCNTYYGAIKKLKIYYKEVN
ncbi:MAG: sigma-70 family RNA polymerase sigma factor [Bacilli bacterium]|nr:sigma-70 family RNA polymerase sigma factor [Bacilli bacterium]